MNDEKPRTDVNRPEYQAPLVRRACVLLAMATIVEAGLPSAAVAQSPLYRRAYSPSDYGRSSLSSRSSTRVPWEAPRAYPFAFPYGNYYGARPYGFNRHFYGYRPYWARSTWPYASRYPLHWYGGLSGYGMSAPWGVRPYSVVPFYGVPYAGYPVGRAGWSPFWGTQGEYVPFGGAYYAVPYGGRSYGAMFPGAWTGEFGFGPCNLPHASLPDLSVPDDYYGFRPYQWDCVPCLPEESGDEVRPDAEPAPPSAEPPLPLEPQGMERRSSPSPGPELPPAA